MALHILIVDDSSVMRAMIKKTIKMTQIPISEIYEAEDGKKGLETIEKQWIDLVFADINKPVMNGEEMIRHMKQNVDLDDIPIIVISTEGSETRIQRLKQNGVRFIHKPFSPEMITDVVNELINIGVKHE